MEARRSAHPHVRINHRIDALPRFFLGFMSRMLPPAVTDKKFRISSRCIENLRTIGGSRTAKASASALSSSDGVLLPSSERGGCAFPLHSTLAIEQAALRFAKDARIIIS